MVALEDDVLSMLRLTDEVIATQIHAVTFVLRELRSQHERHIRNKIEGVNRSRGEAGETIHHLFMAKLKGYIDQSVYGSYRSRYKECIRMPNGLEKSLEKHLPESERRWPSRDKPGTQAPEP